MIHSISKHFMKHRISTVSLAIFLCFTACASHKKINRLTKDLDCNKTILFVWEEAGNDVNIDRKGFSAGNSPYLDYRKTFQKSIEELNKHTNANLMYRKPGVFSSDSVVQVKVLVKEITWTFGFSSALMETELQYQLDEEIINLTGKNKVYLGGTKTGNLFKSFKDGHYQFLNYICKSKNSGS